MYLSAFCSLRSKWDPEKYHCKIYLPKLQNLFVQIAQCICQPPFVHWDQNEIKKKYHRNQIIIPISSQVKLWNLLGGRRVVKRWSFLTNVSAEAEKLRWHLTDRKVFASKIFTFSWKVSWESGKFLDSLESLQTVCIVWTGTTTEIYWSGGMETITELKQLTNIISKTAFDVHIPETIDALVVKMINALLKQKPFTHFGHLCRKQFTQFVRKVEPFYASVFLREEESYIKLSKVI